ncbi:MAG: FGGY family carbohydrate kinase, partial [Verrucomicrobiota bacterium]
MSTKRFLAVDLGASGGKCFAGLFDNGTFSMREIHRFAYECVSFHLPARNATCPQCYNVAGAAHSVADGPDRAGQSVERMVWDDTLIYAHILNGLRAYRREVGQSLDAIGIDTWGADGQFVTEDGDLLGKVYAYRDHRLDTMIDQVKARIPAERIYAITGIHFQPFNVSNQVLWFLQNRKHLLTPGSRFVPIPSLFYYYLGGIVKVDSSWASVTQLMDAKLKNWSGEILDKLGIPP